MQRFTSYARLRADVADPPAVREHRDAAREIIDATGDHRLDAAPA